MIHPDEIRVLLETPGAILAVDNHGRISYATPQAAELLGWDASIVGQPLTAIIPPRLHPSHRAGFDRYVKTGQSNLQGRTVRVPARRRDGSEVSIDLTIRVFRRPDGSKLVSAGLSEAPLGRPPPGLLVLESALQRRLYALI